MKKTSCATVFFYLACMALFVSHGLASTDKPKPLSSSKYPQVWPYLHLPHFPKFPPRVPGYGGALPPLPPHKALPPAAVDAIKCWSDIHNIKGCVYEIFSAFYTHNLDLTPQCCKPLTQLTHDCSTEVFGHFHNPLFILALTEHCQAAAAPSPQHY
ncbi:uncharacterized protein LOC132281640 [Cornus florida]|uniref:uncharacterized protein LOC132281640 n=1 Tax=Cornus florida TaxID=4283 RepID=UPI002898BB40|nr:uncharacterized protein LOC132281640 [Cornus florida]